MSYSYYYYNIIFPISFTAINLYYFLHVFYCYLYYFPMSYSYQVHYNIIFSISFTAIYKIFPILFTQFLIFFFPLLCCYYSF